MQNLTLCRESGDGRLVELVNLAANSYQWDGAVACLHMAVQAKPSANQVSDRFAA